MMSYKTPTDLLGYVQEPCKGVITVEDKDQIGLLSRRRCNVQGACATMRKTKPPRMNPRCNVNPG